ncbi:Uma2 family endonuclease [Pilimelia anulata]|uniref:Uma2 family endonuclease n=1 Tax=Pilimelia anulata TaxID=53371 RepID=UPI0016658B8E|nr:Uma2 family endonuclease [Pilimelia anulata]
MTRRNKALRRPGSRPEMLDAPAGGPGPTAPLPPAFVDDVRLALHARCPSGYRASAGPTLQLAGGAHARPDLAVVPAAAGSPVPVDGALLIVDIVGPEATVREVFDRARRYAAADVLAYWLLDPLGDRVRLTEFLRGARGAYEFGAATEERYETIIPYPITLDLPALGARRGQTIPNR